MPAVDSSPIPQPSLLDRFRLFWLANKKETILAVVSAFFLLALTAANIWLVPRRPSQGFFDPVATLGASLATPSAVLGEETAPEETELDSPPVADSAPAPAPQPEPAGPSHSATFLGAPNNKFGMYINAEASQVAEVAPLINSNGGDWGWVLLPFPIFEHDAGKWQQIFDTCAAHHLKPLVQLFNNNTCNLEEMNFDRAASFLHGLHWPTQRRYISVFNELNAKDYWCERLAPEEYARALEVAINAFKGASSDFFLMPGAFNSSARTGPRYLDEEDYLLRMNQAVPGIFSRLDGWATHAYPQPEFSGDFYNPPSWYGVRDQIENYKWELNLLSRHFGVSGLPIFITETGWAHREGSMPKKEYKDSSVAARYFDDAYRNHWLKDNRIVAVMPFVWYKTDAPNFNWKKPDGTFYPQYDVVMKIPKVAGTKQ